MKYHGLERFDLNETYQLLNQSTSTAKVLLNADIANIDMLNILIKMRY